MMSMKKMARINIVVFCKRARSIEPQDRGRFSVLRTLAHPRKFADSRSLDTILSDIEHAGFKELILITDRRYQQVVATPSELLDYSLALDAEILYTC